MPKHDRIGQIMTVSQEDKISDFGVLVVSCNIVQLCFAVFFSLGRRPLSRSHDHFQFSHRKQEKPYDESISIININTELILGVRG